MKGSEFIKKVKKLAKANNLSARVDLKRGKGSHVTLYYGDKFTIVRNPKDELKTGTFNILGREVPRCTESQRHKGSLAACMIDL